MLSPRLFLRGVSEIEGGSFLTRIGLVVAVQIEFAALARRAAGRTMDRTLA
jgi:hypothetical protein